MSVWHLVEYFDAREFVKPEAMHPGLLLRLDNVRRRAGVPVIVTSSWRDGDPKSHGRGTAVDISDNASGNDCSSAWRAKVLPAAIGEGFVRIGIYDRHIHLDVDEQLPQNVIWWGTSK